MITKIKNSLRALALLLFVAIPLLLPASAFAACSGTSAGIADGANSALNSGNDVDCDSPSGANSAQSKLKRLAGQIVNLLSLIVGIAAVIMIIVGGFRYIVSGGDSNKVGGAKNTILFALIGLIIVALAQIIVHFVLATTVDATKPTNTRGSNAIVNTIA